MSIIFDEQKKIFKMDTENTSYLIGITPEGYVGHIYYGKSLKNADGYYLLRTEESPFTPSVMKREKGGFLDTFAMEYPTGGLGDHRESCLDIIDENGCRGCEILFDSYEIVEGKPALEGLPASFGEKDDVSTLLLHCVDSVLDLEVILSYSVFAAEDIITRSVRVCNRGDKALKIDKVYSACLDMDNRNFQMLSLYGAWARERHIQKLDLMYGRQRVSSDRGMSSSQESPFVALITPGTNQEQGEVYAMNFVYSGNFVGQVERAQFDTVRMVMGILSENFGWNLLPGSEFQAPEVVMTYSAAGLGKMSRSYHDFYRTHLMRSKFTHSSRPVLCNTWEAYYFDFEENKLVDFAKKAAECGIEMMVLDDGWFGTRNTDSGSLGDWTVDKNKLPSGLPALVDNINKLGLKFGIWFEPEMISPESDLYRKHPEWAIQLKDREITEARAQYVLDLSNPEVVDYCYEQVAAILKCANIAYLKWDMNRGLDCIGSSYLDKESQKELLHRYVLGVYSLQERLTKEFPDLLLENCASGGSRFDPGMLYYSPQIWCSDNMDVVERLQTHEGTALVYPLSCISNHVGSSPSSNANRYAPFETRCDVAYMGAFGYELDLNKISDEESGMIKEQIKRYHQFEELIHDGDYYRIASYSENNTHDCWNIVAKDKTEAMMTYVQVRSWPNSHSRVIRVAGLEPSFRYRLEGTDQVFDGDLLVNGGILIKDLCGDTVSRIYHFVKED